MPLFSEQSENHAAEQSGKRAGHNTDHKSKKMFFAAKMLPRTSPIKHWAKLVSPNRQPRPAPASGPITTAPTETGIISNVRDKAPILK